MQVTPSSDLFYSYVKEIIINNNVILFFCLKLNAAYSIVLIPFLSRSWRFYWGRHAHLHVYLCGLQLADLAGMFDFSCHIQGMVRRSLSPVFHHILWLHSFCDLNRIFMVKVRSGPWKEDLRYGKLQSKARFLNVDINTVGTEQSFHQFLLCLVLHSTESTATTFTSQFTYEWPVFNRCLC